jgi:hypothetical protein
MASKALVGWRKRSTRVLDEIEAAHGLVGGRTAAGRFAAQQINHAYVVLLCSQYCRDLHTESIGALTSVIGVDPKMVILKNELSERRKLDAGNPNPGNLGADFGRLGVDFWNVVDAYDPASPRFRKMLEQLCTWRNAIAHQDFDPTRLRGKILRLSTIRQWRAACDALAACFDAVMDAYLRRIMGRAPW